MFEQLLRGRQAGDALPGSLLPASSQPTAVQPAAPTAALRLPQPFQGFAWPWQQQAQQEPQQQASPAQPARGVAEDAAAPASPAAPGRGAARADSTARADAALPGVRRPSVASQPDEDRPAALPLQSQLAPQPGLRRGDAASRETSGSSGGAEAGAGAASMGTSPPQKRTRRAEGAEGAMRQQEDVGKASGTRSATTWEETGASAGRPAERGFAGDSGGPGAAEPEPDLARRPPGGGAGDEAAPDLTSQLLEASGLPLRLREDGLPEADAALAAEERLTIGSATCHMLDLDRVTLEKEGL